MRAYLILLISICTLSASGQIEPIVTKKVEESLMGSIKNDRLKNDSISLVDIVNKNKGENWTAIHVNGKLIKGFLPGAINPQLIDSIHVETGARMIEGKNYNGQIFINMKDGYNPKLISLTDLRLKYIGSGSSPAIFFLENELITGDYSEFLVDDNFILKIIVDAVECEKQNLDVDVIRLYTKTEENRKRFSKIMIKG